MRLGLIGDIHGNQFALQAVLRSARAAGVEKLVITGDFVGYYFWPVEVLDLLGGWDFVAVRGNHEDMLAKALVEPAYLREVDRVYGSGLRIAVESLTAKQLRLLIELPHPLRLMIDGASLLLCHGAPWDVDTYIYPDSAGELLVRCTADTDDWVVGGHTHYPMVKKLGRTTMINPGSVGQARNGVPAAHWALLDTGSRDVVLHTETYDAAPVVAAARARHPDIPYLADVLLRRR